MENINEMKYEQAYERLEEIVGKMSEASVPLDELMKLYEEGMELAEHCEKLLKSYDARLEKVSAKAVQREMEDAPVPDDEDDGEAPF
ncbi:MAG: exodeoxyribonuclease VII small subunit [Clostridia bacterium]|nr:exodeoxyribonuclease VII small subunit [Clostridia bacterium]